MFNLPITSLHKYQNPPPPEKKCYKNNSLFNTLKTSLFIITPWALEVDRGIFYSLFTRTEIAEQLHCVQDGLSGRSVQTDDLHFRGKGLELWYLLYQNQCLNIKVTLFCSITQNHRYFRVRCLFPYGNQKLAQIGKD